ncbi:MAG: glutathione S-transferase [Pseudomonadota bacterium]
MIDLYTAPTGNGLRAAVALAESGLAYKVHKLDLGKGEAKSAEYLKMNPAAMIPTIVDNDGPGGKKLTVTQSGAITLYVAEKAGKFLPRDAGKRAEAMQWFMQACTDVAATGSALFQLNNNTPEKSPAIIGFFETRLVGAMAIVDGQLAGKDFLVGELSVADLALYPRAGGAQADDREGRPRQSAALDGRHGGAAGRAEGHAAAGLRHSGERRVVAVVTRAVRAQQMTERHQRRDAVGDEFGDGEQRHGEQRARHAPQPVPEE